ncbi:MAG: CotH kinase family protein [Bacteroidales bacterium]
MKLIRVLLLLLFFNQAVGQNFPGSGPLYTDHEVSRIDILIPPDSLEAIYDDLENEYEYHAAFVLHNSQVSHDTITDIGFRLRGKTSLVSEKKSFKVSFNTYVQGRKYYGVEKLNLNGEHNDPSIIRTKLCWNLCKRFGIPAPRSNHAEVYINGAYYGLYMNVEHIDENFVKSRFGNNNGNLYKCNWPADLVYLGSDPDLYKYGNNGLRAYELKTNTIADDYADLAWFIDVLNNTPSDSLHIRLDQVFNIQSYLKYLVFECITGHWDGYSFNKNNFYLYHNLSTGKFEFIPYDVDNTFGIDWMNIDWGDRNIYNWYSSEQRPLTQRILQNPYYREQFSFYMNQFLEDHFNPQILFPEIDSIYLMIYPFAAADPFRPLDYGWSSMQFTLSYTQPLGAHVKYGLKPYITTRHNSALQQLDLQEVPKLVINEFMAENNTVIADNYGEYDDWIEIFNPGNEPVFLGDKFLTDDLNDPDKWLLPSVTMDPGDYLLIWADAQVSQGSNHAVFKLDKEGEQLGIFTSPANGSLPIDILTFGSQTVDISSGIYPNGDGIFQMLQFPTPGASNSQPLAIPEIQKNVNINIYPNPFRESFYLQTTGQPADTQYEISLLDITGKTIYDKALPSAELINTSYSVDPGTLPPGMYFLRLQSQQSTYQTVKILKIQ